MMNVIQIQDRLKSFSEDQLAKEMESPSGSAPQYLVLSEFNRRKRVKADYEQQQNAQQQSSTVAEDVLAASGMPQAGLGALAQNMAPKTDMVQNSGAAPQQTMPMPEAPDAMAEIDPSEGGLAAMAGGGSVKRMAKGGRTQVVHNGMGYFVYADGDVQDAIGQPVSDEVAQAVKGSISVGPEIPEFDPNDMMPSFDVGDSRTLDSAQRPEGDDSPSISNVSPSLEDVMGLELGPPTPQQFSSMGMVPSFDVGELNTLADPEVIAASEQLPTRPRSLEPIYSETASPMFRESTYEQGLESTPDTGEMQRPALPTIGGDPRISGNTEVGILPRGFQDLRSPQEVDLDLVSEASDKPSRSIDQQLLSKALEAKSLPITPTQDFRREFADYGDDISPFDPSDIKSNIQKAVSDLGLTPITRDGEEYFISPAGMVFKQEGDDLVPVAGGEAMQAMDVAQRQGKDFSVSPMGMIEIGSRDVDPRTGLVDPNAPFKFAEADISGTRTPQFLTDALGPGSTISDFLNVQEGAAPVTKVDETGVRLAPASPAEGVVGFDAQPSYDDFPMPDSFTQADPTTVPDGFTLGTAGDAASNALSFGNLSGLTADSKDGAGKAVLNPDRPTGAPTKPRGGAAPTGVESEILELLKKREEQFDSDKWLALARAGMAMMTSKSSNLLGAIGEGAATGLESLTQSRSAYNDAKLDLLTMRQKLEAARAKGTGSLGASSTNLTSIYNNLTDENTKLRKDIAAADAIDPATGEPVGNSNLLKQALVKNEMDIDEVKRRLQFTGGVLQTEDVRDGPKTTNKTPSLSEIPELPYALGESVG